MPEDYRPTEPVHTYEYESFAQVPPDDLEPAPPPARSPRGNSLLWVGAVVVVFMAVPLFASLTTRSPVRAKAPAASAPVAAVEPQAPAPAPAVRNVPTPPPAPVVPDRPAPVPARALPDPSQQVVTKCVERGRVVYTQTGDCSGSVSAVPIDTDKNVVGPARDAARR